MVDWGNLMPGNEVCLPRASTNVPSLRVCASNASRRHGRYFHVQVDPEKVVIWCGHAPAHGVQPYTGGINYSQIWAHNPALWSRATDAKTVQQARSAAANASRRHGARFRARVRDDVVWIVRLPLVDEWDPMVEHRRLRKEMPVGAQVVVSESTDDMTVRQARQHARKCRQKWRQRYAVRVEDRGTVIERVA